ncbi:MAG: YIP1 family protein [Candidatus Melainabacteria bacterium]|nr:MAG: YIP1 family protein [Candidatus Melainabacteria bacterium]
MPDEKDQAKKSVTERMMDQVNKVNTPENQGAVKFIIYQAQEVMLKPKEFFPNVVEHGSPVDARFFLFGVIVIASLLTGITNLNLFYTLTHLFTYLISTYLTAFFSWWLFMQFGSPKPFGKNFIVIAYSQAVLLIAGIQLGPLGVITFLASTAYGVYLQLLGMQILHKLALNTIILVLAIIAVIQVVLKFVLQIY